MRSTIKDVAKFANVSPATVSLVLNNKPGVNAETRRQVQDAVEKLGYRPNQIARSLITQKSSTIGLIVTNIDNPFYGDLVYNVQKEVDKTNYNLLLGISNDSVIKEKSAIESMISRDVEGIIVVPTRDGEHDLSHLYNLKSLNIPFVFITSAYNGIQADCVMTDFEHATSDLTGHLLDKGERKIYFITEKRTLMLSDRRIKGYENAFKQRGLDFNPSWIIETNPNVQSGIDETKKILEKDKPDAIIALNATTSLGVMKCLKDYNISVPDEVAVAGFDDLIYSSILYTPLTSVNQPMMQMCRYAVELLLQRVEGDKKPFWTELLGAEMIVRDSTK